MDISVQKVEGVSVVSISGRLTSDHADFFKRRFVGAEDIGANVVLDLSAMDYIDSTGLGAMVSVLQRYANEGGLLKLAAMQQKPRMVFNITKAYKIFDIFDTVADAVSAIKSAAPASESSADATSTPTQQ